MEDFEFDEGTLEERPSEIEERLDYLERARAPSLTDILMVAAGVWALGHFALHWW